MNPRRRRWRRELIKDAVFAIVFALLLVLAAKVAWALL
jgi:hypothetical protein